MHLLPSISKEIPYLLYYEWSRIRRKDEYVVCDRLCKKLYSPGKDMKYIEAESSVRSSNSDYNCCELIKKYRSNVQDIDRIDRYDPDIEQIVFLKLLHGLGKFFQRIRQF